MQPHKKSGFTLVELAIVLVIIGLIVGGVLTGKDLIEAAEIRAATSESQAFRAGYLTFRAKYQCVAGDCRSASKFLEGAVDGDGNSLISCTGGASICRASVQEHEEAFKHLAQAGLIKSGMYANDEFMSARIGSCQFFVFENLRSDNLFYGASTGNYLWINQNIDGSPYHANCLTPTQAEGIDLKLDDGFAGTGKVYGYAQDSGDNSECADKPYNAGRQPKAAYNVQNDDIGCVIKMKLD